MCLAPPARCARRRSPCRHLCRFNIASHRSSTRSSFVGNASNDASFLEDWRSNTARFMTQNFALLQSDGQELGYTEGSGGGTLDYITGPGSYDTTQLWMASLYDFNLLYRWEIDRADAALGVPAIAPSRARRAWARALLDAPLIPPGDGTAAGVWPNSVRFSFSGARVGGTLTRHPARLVAESRAQLRKRRRL